MTGSTLVPSTNAIAQYGDRGVIKELGERLKRFLPNGDKMSEQDALGFAQAALALDLNPFAHEVWFVPGMGIVTGIAGYRKMARAQGPFVAETRPMSPEERDKHNLKDTDIGAICELHRPDQILDAVRVNEAAGRIIIPIKPTIGVGIWRIKELKTRSGKVKSEPTGRSWLWVAEKRAEADALRKAFDMTVPYQDNGIAVGDIQIIEGEAIDEPIVQLTPWAVEALKDKRDLPTAAAVKQMREILHGSDEDADWDAPPQDLPPEIAITKEELIGAIETLQEQMPSPPDLPTEWQPFAKHAIRTLGYRNMMHVRDTLHEQGIPTICTPLGALEFDPVDGWALLQDQAPEPKAEQEQML